MLVRNIQLFMDALQLYRIIFKIVTNYELANTLQLLLTTHQNKRENQTRCIMYLEYAIFYCINGHFHKNFLNVSFIENQPVPPTAKCEGKEKCGKNKGAQGQKGPDGGLEFDEDQRPDPKAVDIDLERFCRFRDDGEHAIPANCDVFIYCSNGWGSFRTCPNITKFNPVIRTCDYPVNFECENPGFNRK